VTATIGIEEAGAAPRTLWQARINPFAAGADNAEKEFAVEAFRVQQPATLRISFGIAENAVCDWSYLRDVRVESVQR
jgi:hypothetical protein